MVSRHMAHYNVSITQQEAQQKQDIVLKRKKKKENRRKPNEKQIPAVISSYTRELAREYQINGC